MATIDDYIAQIVSEKETIPELNALTSASRVGIWRLWVYLVAKIAYLLDALFLSIKNEIEAEFANVPFGSLPWYRAKALEFQKGDTLVHNATNFTFGYAVIDETKKVVKQCAVVADGGNVVFKIATAQEGELQPIDAATAAQFEAYMNKIKYAGTVIQVINKPADILRLQAAVMFDAEREPGSVIDELKKSALAYLETIIFDGVFSLTAFVDMVQTVNGVGEVVVVTALAKAQNSPVFSNFAQSGRYKSVAGYMVYEDIENLFDLIVNE